MTGCFDGLDRLDLDGHVRRWSAPGVAAVEGDVSQWMAAAQQFAARLRADPGGPAGLTDEQWHEVGRAWAALLADAERATGPQGDERLLRDLWLRSWLREHGGPRPGVALLDPGLCWNARRRPCRCRPGKRLLRPRAGGSRTVSGSSRCG
ncbi:hypothetical protein ACFYZ8_11065 [Streptomyces sp. NPDC001668]|uniref:hypothetical protein n=1 Tax=unclassified Streptomyces TaxID=2593676 RepID=UPI00367A86AF